MNPVDQRRLATLPGEGNRRRSALASSMIRHIVGLHTGIAAASVVVARTCGDCGADHGRPQLPGSGLWVSVSHSADSVVVALTDAGEVGVDVEAVRDLPVKALAGRVLTRGEQATVHGVRDLLVCWTRKEAVLKATGQGLTVSMGEVGVGPPGEDPHLSGYPGGAPTAQLFDLVAPPGYVAALAVLANDQITVRRRDFAATFWA